MMQLASRRYIRALLNMSPHVDLHRYSLQVVKIFASLLVQKKISSFFLNPAHSADRKKKLLKEVLTKLSVEKWLEAFFMLLIDVKRLDLLPDMYLCYKQEINKLEKVVDVDVFSATSLNEPNEKYLKELLSKKWQKTIRLHPHIDKTLLGGFVLRWENNELNMSLYQQIETLTLS